MRQLVSGLTATLAGLLLLAGCTSGGGVADQAADSDFAACVERAGLSLDGADDWSEQEERDFLSQPRALDCVVSDVPADDRADLLSRAFPDDSGSDEEAREKRAAKTDALVAFVTARMEVGEGAREQTVADAAALMNAFGWDETDPWVGDRKQVALAITRAEGGAASYDEWLDDTGRDDDYAGRIDFVQEQETEGTPLAEEVRALAAELEES